MKQLTAQLLLLGLVCIAAKAGPSGTPSGSIDAVGSSGNDSSENPWELTASAGVNLAGGNSDMLNAGAQVLASYVTLENELYLGADYYFGENEGQESVNNIYAFGSYKRMFAGNTYWGLGADYRSDEIADIDYRISALPVLGHYLIKDDATQLAFETGPAYVWQKLGGAEEGYFALNLSERFSHTFGNGIRFTQSLSYMAEAADFGNYLLVADAGLEMPISSHWAVKTLVRDIFNSEPAAGREENDLSVLAGLSYSASGFEPAPKAGRRTLFTNRAPAKAAPGGWTNIGAAGFGMTSGNSDTLLMTASYDAAYRAAAHEFFFGLGGAYGEVDSALSAQNLRAGAQYNWLFSDRIFVGEGVNFLHNEISDTEYRVSPGAVLGAYLIKSDAVSLSIEGGPSYVFEKVGGQTDDYLGLQASEKLSVVLSDTVTVGQTATWSAEAGDMDNSLYTASAFVDYYMAHNLAFRTSVNYTFDNTPAKGKKDDDISLSAGIAVRF